MNDSETSAAAVDHPNEKDRIKALRDCVEPAFRDHPALREIASVLPPDTRAVALACEELRMRLARSKRNGEPVEATELFRLAADFITRAFTRSDIVVAFAELSVADQAAAQEFAGAGNEVPRDDSTLAGRLETARLAVVDPETKQLRFPNNVRLFLLASRSQVRPGPPSEGSGPPVAEAEQVLRGKTATPREMLNLSGKLKAFNQFGLARRLLARAREDSSKIQDDKLRRQLRQQHALCTYKDPDVPLATRLDRALNILGQEEALDTAKDPETLGIAGAIYKRKWQAEGQREQLEQSLAFYLRGTEGGIEKDYGYTAINAAFIHDCLAEQEAPITGADDASKIVEFRRGEARKLRSKILKKLPPLVQKAGQEWLESAWWFYATLAEAAFGLERYPEAAFWLAKAREIPVHDWEYESTAQQLAALARIHTSKTPDAGDGFLAKAPDQINSPQGRAWQAWMVIARLLGSRSRAESKFIGKVGLALSGGGFRASLFHIGVLARLAELDLLRSVEVLSCVSGGSIIGAHYYLELRKLLEEKTDEEITAGDYVGIVQRIVDDFPAGVQRNIRTRVAAQFWTNLQMFWRSNYSRTHCAGELYEKEIFSRISVGNKPAATPIFFFDPSQTANAKRGYDLKILPKPGEKDTAAGGFNPKLHNWRRGAKVPQLILNATTLNTGHNWQFTATFMGEPPGAIDPSIDGNDRLRRMYHNDAPAPHNKLRLGYAVGASACVPAIFEPLPMEGLYPGMTVRLVDGGVHDNQGVAGLLEQDATFLIVSDASGQMGVQSSPSSGVVGVPLRANDILMARVRTAEAQDLRSRDRAGLLRGLMFMHLKKDLEVDPVDWVACSDPYAASDEARLASRRARLTTYGIRKDMQERIAALRTDLDSFSEAEAFALMTSGYRMAEREFTEQIKDIGRKPWPRQNWKFLSIEKHLNLSTANDPAAAALLHQLEVGSQLAFKVWRLSPFLRKLSYVLGILAAAALAWACVRWHAVALVTVGGIGITLLIAALAALLGKRLMQVVNFRAELRRIFVILGVCLGGFLLAQLHLWIFDPWFLRIGKVDRLAAHKPSPPNPALRSTLSLLLALLLASAWFFYKSDRVQRRILISRAPVAQALAAREEGAARVIEWAAALDAANEREAGWRVWQQLDATIARLPASEGEQARGDAAAKGHTPSAPAALSREQEKAVERCAWLRKIAHDQLHSARPEDARATCLDAIKAAGKIHDVSERSRALADTATIIAATGDTITARALADRCAMATDRLGAYTTIFAGLSSRPRQDGSANPPVR